MRTTAGSTVPIGRLLALAALLAAVSVTVHGALHESLSDRQALALLALAAVPSAWLAVVGAVVAGSRLASALRATPMQAELLRVLLVATLMSAAIAVFAGLQSALIGPAAHEHVMAMTAVEMSSVEHGLRQGAAMVPSVLVTLALGLGLAAAIRWLARERRAVVSRSAVVASVTGLLGGLLIAVPTSPATAAAEPAPTCDAGSV